MKVTTLGKYLALAFVVIIFWMTSYYFVINFYEIKPAYGIFLITMSCTTIFNLVNIAIGDKNRTVDYIIILFVSTLVFSVAKAFFIRTDQELNDSSLLWFQYKETMNYGLKFLWHWGLNLFTLVGIIFFKYLPGLCLTYFKSKPRLEENHYH